MKPKVPAENWHPMSLKEIEMVRALQRMVYFHSSPPHRFAKNLAKIASKSRPRLPDKMRVAMAKQAITFRRQIRPEIVHKAMELLKSLGVDV